MIAAPAQPRVGAAAQLLGLTLARPSKEPEHDTPRRLLLGSWMEGPANQLIHEIERAPNHIGASYQNYSSTQQATS